MHVLLVEPSYYTRYPPIGLLKLASYHRLKGNTVKLVQGCVKTKPKPDLIYVTSLFTWAWEPVWASVRYYKAMFPAVELHLGGIYASILGEHAKLSGADYVKVGIIPEVENLMPAYDLVPGWDGSIVCTSRGCNRQCPYCAVWRTEGKLNSCKESISHLIYPKHTRIILWDNNILQSPHWRSIFDELVESKKWVDFNQGLDARLIDDEAAEKISKMKFLCVRLSYDHDSMKKSIKNAIETLNAHGVRRRKIIIYVLYNFLDKPDNFFKRIKNIVDWGAVAYPMRYEPFNTLGRNKSIGPKWDEERLRQVEKFRRVCGFGGTFPPYGWLVKRFNKASNFDAAFKLPRRFFDNGKKKRAHNSYFAGWRRKENWKDVTQRFLSKRW